MTNEIRHNSLDWVTALVVTFSMTIQELLVRVCFLLSSGECSLLLFCFVLSLNPTRYAKIAPRCYYQAAVIKSWPSITMAVVCGIPAWHRAAMRDMEESARGLCGKEGRTSPREPLGCVKMPLLLCAESECFLTLG